MYDESDKPTSSKNGRRNAVAVLEKADPSQLKYKLEDTVKKY